MQLAQSDLRSLTVFRTVVEHRSFLGAQIALGLSQSAVSFHIKALEERLGFRLCKRGRGGFGLTDRGAAVYDRSKTLHLALNAFEDGIGSLRNTIAGTLRLGLIDNTITDQSLPVCRVLAAIKRRAPEAVIKIFVKSPETLISELGNGSIDVAILPEIRTYPWLKFSRLKNEHYSLYCSADHPLVSVRPSQLDIDIIQNHSFVVRPYANFNELQFFTKGVATAVASNIEALAMFILSGCHIGYLPDHYAKYWVERGELCAILPTVVSIVSPLFLTTRAGAIPSSLQTLCIKELHSIAHLGSSLTAQPYC